MTGLPSPVRIQYPSFSPKGRYLAFIVVQPEALAVWTVELATGTAKQVTPAAVSAVMRPPFVWAPDEAHLYCRIRPSLEPLPDTQELPAGPAVQEATGRKAPGRTWQDRLKARADERTFERYAACEIKRFALEVGDPANEASARDRVFQPETPFSGAPRPLCTVKSRLPGSRARAPTTGR